MKYSGDDLSAILLGNFNPKILYPGFTCMYFCCMSKKSLLITFSQSLPKIQGYNCLILDPSNVTQKGETLQNHHS